MRWLFWLSLAVVVILALRWLGRRKLDEAIPLLTPPKQRPPPRLVTLP